MTQQALREALLKLSDLERLPKGKGKDKAIQKQKAWISTLERQLS